MLFFAQACLITFLEVPARGEDRKDGPDDVASGPCGAAARAGGGDQFQPHLCFYLSLTDSTEPLSFRAQPATFFFFSLLILHYPPNRWLWVQKFQAALQMWSIFQTFGRLRAQKVRGLHVGKSTQHV